jgi:hypothetical protein
MSDNMIVGKIVFNTLDINSKDLHDWKQLPLGQKIYYVKGSYGGFNLRYNLEGLDVNHQELTSKELLPCPFCGSDAYIAGAAYFSKKLAMCGECSAEHSIEKWNNRSVPAQIETWKYAVAKDNHDINQILGKALGYPEAFPDISDVDDGSVVTGEHIPVTLAMEAAKQLTQTQQKLDTAAEALESVRDGECNCTKCQELCICPQKISKAALAAISKDADLHQNTNISDENAKMILNAIIKE